MTMSHEDRLKELQALAASRGGLCLSTEYVDSHTNLLWQCKAGHTWQATPVNVKYHNGWCPICAQEKVRLGLPDMQALAANKGGTCLSQSYVNHSTPLLWQCSKGHQWEATAYNIKNGETWCPYCAREESCLGLAAMQGLAVERGGQCLSEQYVNSYTPLLWQCREGHQWAAPAVNVKKGHWCRICSTKVTRAKLTGRKRSVAKRLTLLDMQDMATLRGGKCLSDEYVNNYSHLLWQCAVGHQWEATARTMKSSGFWCPTCAHEEKRLGLPDMQALAAEKGGLCLSDGYINAHTNLTWQCGKGHQWEATATSIKHSDSWCPICARVHDKPDDG